MIERFAFTPTYKPKNMQTVSEYDEIKPDITVIDIDEIADYSKTILFRKAYPDDTEAESITIDYVLNTINANISDELIKLWDIPQLKKVWSSLFKMLEPNLSMLLKVKMC